MARQLADVLHHLLPESPREQELERTPGNRQGASAGLPIVTVPVGEDELVRATLGWNLALEMAALGATITVVAPAGRLVDGLVARRDAHLPLELRLPRVRDLAGLEREAERAAAERPDGAAGLVLVIAPPDWLADAPAESPLLSWLLILASPERRSLAASCERVTALRERNPGARIGITSHGARTPLELDGVRRQLLRAATRNGAPAPDHYGHLESDLPVTRALVAGTPLREVANPASSAPRSLRDVGATLLERARDASRAAS